MRRRAGVLALVALLLAGGASAQWWGSVNATHVQGKKVTAPLAGDDNKCLTYDLATQGLVWDTCGVSTATANTWTAPQTMGYMTLSSAGGTNEVVNGTFTGGTTGWTVAGGWVYGTNNVTHSTTDVTALQPSTPLTVAAGERWAVCYSISGYSGSGTLTASIGGVNGTARSANGDYCDWISTTTTDNLFLTPSATAFVATVDTITAMKSDRLRLLNTSVTTAASTSTQSPSLEFESHAWQTSGVDTKQQWRVWTYGTSGASPYGTLLFTYSKDGGAPATALTMLSNGQLTSGSVITGSTLAASAAAPSTTGAISWIPSVTSAAAQTGIRSAPTFTASSGTPGLYKPVAIEPTYDITGAASGMTATDLFINRTETSLGTTPGAQNLIDAQVGGVSKFKVDNTGVTTLGANLATSYIVVDGKLQITGTQINTRNDGFLRWSSTTAYGGTPDLGLKRIRAGVLEISGITGAPAGGVADGRVLVQTTMQQYTLDATTQVGAIVCIDESQATCTGDCVSPCASGSEKPSGVYVGTEAGTAHASTLYLIATSGKAYTIPEEDHADVALGDVVVTATGVAGYAEYSAAVPATHNQETGHAIRASAKITFDAAADVDPTANSIVLDSAPGWAVDDPVVFWNSGDTEPTGMTDGAVYWIKSISTDTVTLSASKGGAVLDITGDGSGTTCYLQKLVWTNLHWN